METEIEIDSKESLQHRFAKNQIGNAVGFLAAVAAIALYEKFINRDKTPKIESE